MLHAFLRNEKALEGGKRSRAEERAALARGREKRVLKTGSCKQYVPSLGLRNPTKAAKPISEKLCIDLRETKGAPSKDKYVKVVFPTRRTKERKK